MRYRKKYGGNIEQRYSLRQKPLPEAQCTELAQKLQQTPEEALKDTIMKFLKDYGKTNFGRRNYWPDIRAYLMTNDTYGIESDPKTPLTSTEIYYWANKVLKSSVQRIEQTLLIDWKYWKPYPKWNGSNEAQSVNDFCNSTNITGISSISKAMTTEQKIPALIWKVNFTNDHPYIIVILGKDEFGSWIFGKVYINHSRHLNNILPKDDTARGIVIPFEVYSITQNNKKNAIHPKIIGSAPALI